MSADNITVCPVCDDHTLREWREVGLTPTDAGVYLEMSYRCKCRACLFEWDHTAKPVKVPSGKLPWVP